MDISLHLLRFEGFIFVFHSCVPRSPLLVLLQHTNSHTNEAAWRALIQADGTQWHPWHFREKAWRFKAPQGCVVRILQTDESLREWMAEGWLGGGGQWRRWRTLGRHGPRSQDIYLSRHAIRGQLPVTLAAVKLHKTRTVLPSYPNEKHVKKSSEGPLELEFFDRNWNNDGKQVIC